MGLKIPDLADTEFDELLEEARKLLPVYSEEWTDHNVHDPGITILEMLAWLGETYIYQLDRVTDEHIRKYLKLMGASPRPPKPASVPLKLWPPVNSAGVRLPAGEPLRVRTDSSSELSFETVSSVILNDARIERVISEHRRGRTDNSNANESNELDFFAFGEAAEEGSSMYLGFEDDPFTGAEWLDLTVSYYDGDLPKPGSHGGEPPSFEPTVEVSWQYLVDYTGWYRDSAWAELSVNRDETNRFYRSGRVRLAKPDDWDLINPVGGVLDQETEFYWLRCVVRTQGYETPPRLESIGLNVVEARHQKKIEDEQLRRPDSNDKTTAHPGQVFEFAHSPVLATTHSLTDPREPDAEDPRIVLRQTDGTTSDPWRRVPDLDSSDPDDEHYVLDQAAGTLRFGNGIRGKVPEAGQTVVAESYVYGGGMRGNVPQTSNWFLENEGSLGEGIYKYYCGRHGSQGMKGAIVVGTLPGEGEDTSVDPDYGDWFKTDVETEDRRGEKEVAIRVGEEGNQFSPAAIRIDPGTRIQFVWRSDGHSISVADQPPEGRWIGHPTIEPAEFEYTYTFDVVDRRAITVKTREAAVGGRDAESVDAALVRLKRDLQTPYRAITTDDYRVLAMNTPGLRFGRAQAIVESSNADDQSSEYGRVRVVVVPHSTGSPSGRPTPSEGFLNAVRHHLEKHRLLTDRVTVEAPTYVGVGVAAEVRIEPGYVQDTVRTEVKTALEGFLDPLEGYNGEGWPFGRPVYRSEIYEVIETHRGIEGVFDVTLTTQGGGHLDSEGNVLLGSLILPYAIDRQVIVSTDQRRSGGR